MSNQQQPGSRRDLLRNAAAAAGSFAILGATAKGAGTALKVGLVGCGARGNRALAEHLNAARILNKALGLSLDLRVAATADYFAQKALATGKRYNVPESHCFGGVDAYRKLLAVDVDIVLLATPPAFRPAHFEAAVAAGKHVFLEKPAAVDPPGCRRVLAAADVADKKGLVVVAGTQRRHQRGYIETQAAVAAGSAGVIKAGRIGWCQRHRGLSRSLGTPTLDGFIASWRNWAELSGDHIVDQHIHNIDVANWFLRAHPIAAVGFGGRARRPAGNTYDFFSIDFEYPGGVHVHSMCRQINATHVWIGEQLIAAKPNDDPEGGVTKAIVTCSGGFRPATPVIPEDIPQDRRAHQQEHIHMLYWLARRKPINQARDLAIATATAILGRTAAYTGKRIAWRDMMEDPKRHPDLYGLTLKPTADDIERGVATLPAEGAVPIPGTTAT